MNLSVFPLFLLTFQFACYIVGIFVVKKSMRVSKGASGYFLSERSLSKWSFMFTLLATQIGGGLLIGSAEEAYHSGWVVVFLPLGAALGLVVLGLGLGKKFAKFNVLTVSAILKETYKSSLLQKIGGILSSCSLFILLLAQMVTSLKLLHNFGLYNIGWFLAFWFTIVFYTSRGGFRSVVATDIVQAIFFSLGLFGAFIILCCSKNISVSHVIHNCPAASFSASNIISWFILPLFFVMVEQDLIQRFFSVSDKKFINSFTLLAAGISLCVTILPVIFGLVAAAEGVQPVEGTSILITFIHNFFPKSIDALLGCAILAAIVSSADSFINSLAASIIGDLFNEKHLIVQSNGIYQLVSLIIGVIAIAFSLFFSNIFSLLMHSYEITVVCLACPTIMAIIKKGPHNKESAFCAIFFGLVGLILFHIIPVNIPSEFLGIVFSIFGFIIGEVISKKRIVVSLNNK